MFYYSLPLSVFSVFGYTYLGKAVEWVAARVGCSRIWKKTAATGVLLLNAGLLILTWNLSMNTDFAKMKEEDFFLYKFRDIVMQEEDPTLLTISCLDAGLYTVADIVPTCRYFQSNAVHGFDEVREEQLKYIREGRIEFVLARDTYPEELVHTYDLVGEEPFVSGDKEFIYYLFQKK